MFDKLSGNVVSELTVATGIAWNRINYFNRLEARTLDLNNPSMDAVIYLNRNNQGLNPAEQDANAW